jgi:hypothetical protein
VPSNARYYPYKAATGKQVTGGLAHLRTGYHGNIRPLARQAAARQGQAPTCAGNAV